MLSNKRNHKKYGFALGLYLFQDISSFKSEKGETVKLSRTDIIYKQKNKYLYRLTAGDPFLNTT